MNGQNFGRIVGQTMSDNQHTPTPWELSEIRMSGTKIRPLPEEPIYAIEIYAPESKVPGYHRLMTFTFTSENKAEVLATAKFIVRACNAHDELVALLYKVMRKLAGQHDSDSHLLSIEISQALKNAGIAI